MKNIKNTIGYFSLGYFLFYVPYSALTKALSKGLIPGMDGPISGFQMLPATTIGSFIMFLVLIRVLGWNRYAGRVNVFGLKIPFATSKWTLFSGISASFIIVTTTLAYSFYGISIVFAALLMRGGVLIMAPLIDMIYGRKIKWYSVIAFILAFASIMNSFLDQAGYMLTTAAIINIAAYLTGYLFRLQFMTYTAKTKDKESTYKYFVEEMIVAACCIVIIPLIFAIIGAAPFMLDLRVGFTSFLGTNMLWPALLIGVLYSCLYIFGTRIYLSPQENTYCIPFNRCASLLAGTVASLLLSAFFEGSFFTVPQLISAGILVVAILFLGFPSLVKRRQLAVPALAPVRNILFVCPGNTGRSPMAQAICMDRLKSYLDQQGTDTSNVNVFSAGITGEEGLSISKDAKEALAHLGVQAMPHTSRRIDQSDIENMDQIWCIAESHQQMILEKFPEAGGKIHYMEAIDNISTPHGRGLNAYIDCARQLSHVIDQLIHQKQLNFATS